MLNQVGYWEEMYVRETVGYNASLVDKKQRLKRLLAIDVLGLPKEQQEKHHSRVKYLETDISTITSMLNMMNDLKTAYWDSLEETLIENYDLKRKIINTDYANRLCFQIIGELKIKL